MSEDDFRFDLAAKITHMSDHDLLSALEDFAKVAGYSYFQTREFDRLPSRRCHSSTIIERFGSWKKALAIIGISGGHKREYTAEELVSNLEAIWKEVGRPPGHRQIANMGQRISNHPYKRIWGSVRKACEYISKYHRGEITREQLLSGSAELPRRQPIPL